MPRSSVMPAKPWVDARWRHPSRLHGWAWTAAANSRALKAIGRRIPPAPMSSDIRDVVYVSYLVDAERLARFVPPPLELQRLGPAGEFALFTFLTYRHGHFGPASFGKARCLWPSPIQSNWRIHVFNRETGTRGIQFLSTVITSPPHALAARLLTIGVPMHIPRRARLSKASGDRIELLIEPGRGSAPDAHASLELTAEKELPSPWNLCFESWHGFLEYCVPQDRALCVDRDGRVLRQEIELNIPVSSCRPLEGSVGSIAATAIAGEGSATRPLCFLVDRVRFRLLAELTDA